MNGLTGYRTKGEYFVAGNRIFPVTFSYEFELIPEENPRIVDYYRPPGFSETRWSPLSLEERLKECRLTIQRAKRSDVVLVKKKNAPLFLARHLHKETNDSERIEGSRNAITSQFSEIEFQLNWIWENIGPVSLQGHAAFSREATRLEGAIAFMKWDFDLTQAEALAFSFESFLKKKQLPARNIVHRSLGPLDFATLQALYEQVQEGASTPKANKLTKYLYAVVFRPDLYGEDRVGFEIRNCHNRLGSLIPKFRALASAISLGFTNFYHSQIEELGPIISEEEFNRQPRLLRNLMKDAATYLEARHEGQNLGGAPFHHRFLFALLPWRDHPFIRALSDGDRALFQSRLEEATRDYRNELFEAHRSVDEIDGKIEKMQIALGRWGYESKLHKFMRRGRSIYFTTLMRWPG